MDAEGDVLRGLRKWNVNNDEINYSVHHGTSAIRSTEVVEHCCSIPSLQMGESLANLARDMDTMSFRTPLGVCAGITPFNFPALTPLMVSHGFII